MRLLADVNIAPRTVEFLNCIGHDTIRSSDQLPVTARDETILELARKERRVVLTQDLDFTHIVALSGQSGPTVITLRLAVSRLEYVHSVLRRELARVEADALAGAIVTITDAGARFRKLPIS